MSRKDLVEKYGEEKVKMGEECLEECLGLNGWDLYKMGEIDLEDYIEKN